MKGSLYRLAGAAMVRPVVIAVVFALNVVHPLVHGTFLDSGLLDQALPQLDLIAAFYAKEAI